MAELRFIKMHGAGNDFVVLDGRAQPIAMTGARARAIADRRLGVGCDQLIVLEPAQSSGTDVFMRIFNPDGSEAGACGNATRCVAHTIMAEAGTKDATIETVSGLLVAEAATGGLVTVDMGLAKLDWRDIPLAEPCDTLHLNIESGALKDPVGVNMGNPHAVFFVDDAEALDLARLGPAVEHHPLFPERTNVEAAEILAPDRIRLRVWERGAGETLACGSGACATLVAAHRRGLTGRKADIVVNGGTLAIEWLPDDHVLMTGPVATSFTGTLDMDVLP